MPLLDHWKNYFRDYPSPDTIVEAGFYSLISASLQRRVFSGSRSEPIYINMFMIPVGPPGNGKSLVIRRVKKLLQSIPRNTKALTQKEQNVIQNALAAVQGEANASDLIEIKKNLNPPLLIPLGADSTNLQALIEELSNSPRPYKDEFGELQYQCSSVFILDELSDLVKRGDRDFVDKFKGLYDCQEDFKYKTISRGWDIIKNVCVSILAGTNFDFLQECFQSKLLNNAMTSRCIFVCEEGPKDTPKYEIPEANAEQAAGLEIVKARIPQLQKFAGLVRMSPDCLDYARYYYEQELPLRRNPDPKLDYYYNRFRLHMDKICMAIHFADSDEMIMERKSMEASIKYLETIEKKMHLALQGGERNANLSLNRKVLKYIQTTGGKPEGAILVNFLEDLPDGIRTLNTILEELKVMGRIEHDGKKWLPKKINGNEHIIVPQPEQSKGEKLATLLEKFETKAPESSQT